MSPGALQRILHEHGIANLHSTRLGARLKATGKVYTIDKCLRIKAAARSSVSMWIDVLRRPKAETSSSPIFDSPSAEVLLASSDGRNSSSPNSESSFDVVILCALPSPELDAVERAFSRHGTWRELETGKYVHRYQHLELFSSRRNKVRVAIGAPLHMGLTSTAIMATQAIVRFQPKLILMSGIAAGVQAETRNFGDPLVISSSVDYAAGKLTVRDQTRTFEPDPNPIKIDPRLHTLFQNLGRTRTYLDEIQDGWPGESPSHRLNIHVGPVGAADQVIDDIQRVDEVKRHWRKLIGFEMETYALYQAAIEAPRPAPLFLAIKSVCDFASNKDDRWRRYAAYTSAELCARFLVQHWEEVLSFR